MSEKLDVNNYDTELEYLLDNKIFELEDYEEFYNSGKLSEEEWEIVKDWFNECL